MDLGDTSRAQSLPKPTMWSINRAKEMLILGGHDAADQWREWRAARVVKVAQFKFGKRAISQRKRRPAIEIIIFS